MDEPLVSVIIPVYNTKRYLTQCLESVVQQTYQNPDILIIDDGSTDGSSNLCDEFAQKDKRILVYHTENNGLSAARNYGIGHAKGAFISFLDSDDWIEQHTIETMLETAIQTDSEIVAATVCYEYCDRSDHSHPQEEPCQSFQGNDVYAAFVNGVISDVAWNKLYRINCISITQFPEGKNYEDIFSMWKLMLKIAETNGSVAVLAEELFHYRIRKNSISHTKSAKNLLDRLMPIEKNMKV